MGIWGLNTVVRKYGVRSPLSGRSIVIDGPALCHHILDGCMRLRPNPDGFICHPSYSKIGTLLIRWLDDLRRHNVTVRKIYFDGYLPPSKWPERQERLARQSQSLKTLLDSHPHGSPKLPQGAFDGIEGDVSLCSSSIGVLPLGAKQFPRPPLLVPAVLDILKGSHTWGSLVEVVSGEADMFCAENIRRHGGVLLTNDSDLLITDLGNDGLVSFFGDIEVVDPSDVSQGVIGLMFCQKRITRLLRLERLGGLARFAYEVRKKSISFGLALRLATRDVYPILTSKEFLLFMEEFSMKEYLPRKHPIQGLLRGLDPRISELIIQNLITVDHKALAEAGTPLSSRGLNTLAMFLPIMVENRAMKSAWSMSTEFRQIAYGVMQIFATRTSPVVIEYRLLDVSNPAMGRRVKIPRPPGAFELCTQLTATLKKLSEKFHDAKLRWLALVIYQELKWSISEERPSLAASLLNDAQNVSESVSNGVSENIPESVPDSRLGDISEGVSVDISEDTPQDISEVVSEEVLEDTPKDVTEDISEDVPKQTPEEASKDVYEGIPGDAPKDASEDVFKEVPEGVFEGVAEDLSEVAPKEVFENESQDVSEDTSKNMPGGVSANAVKEIPKASDQYSWDLIHFTAQVHASLYSLRMIKQGLDAAALLCKRLPPEMRELHMSLIELPGILEWPIVENMEQSLAAAREADILSILTNTFEMPKGEDSVKPNKKEQPMTRKERRAMERLAKLEATKNTPTSTNPYAVLSDAPDSDQ